MGSEPPPLQPVGGARLAAILGQYLLRCLGTDLATRCGPAYLARYHSTAGTRCWTGAQSTAAHYTPIWLPQIRSCPPIR